MAYQAETNAATRRYAQMKARIRKTQGCAKAVGVLYLLATLAVTALACLQLFTLEGATVGVLEFWKPFTVFAEGGAILATIRDNLVELIVAALYAVMLLVLAINVLRGLCKLGWLFKSKASKLYGFNRNMYAMDDLGKIFSSSFGCIVSCYFLMTLFAAITEVKLLAYILLGTGVLCHLILGSLAGNVSLFTTENGIYEEKRKVGNVSPFIRNLLQIAAAAACVYFFLQCSQVPALVQTLLAEGGIQSISEAPLQIIVPALHVLLAVLLVCMLSYAVSGKEFDSEGPKEKGRKSFLVFSLLTLLAAGGAYVYAMIANKEYAVLQLLYIAGIALVAFILEICLRKYPKRPTTNPDDVEVDTYLTENDDEPKQNANPYPFPFPFLPYGNGTQTQSTDKKADKKAARKSKK